MKVVSADEGCFQLKVPFREELIGDPVRPALHGGVMSTLIDTAGGGAAWTVIEDGQRVSTVDLTVDYLRPGPTASIVATARVVRKGNRVVLTTIEVHPEGEDDLLALGRAVYNIHDPR
jgi:uncharacterized protein (TIGR00369 family)